VVKEVLTSTRSDGRETRDHIIECAGRIYARDGYYKATSKEICETAGVNQGAVNYHFGNRDGLYKAVLAEAHRHIIDIQSLKELKEKPGAARDKVLAVINQLIKTVNNSQDWYIRVWVREMVTPSPIIDTIIEDTAMPKFKIIFQFWEDYLETTDSALVYAAMISVCAPFAFCLIGEGKPASQHIPNAPTKEAFLSILKNQAETILDAVKENIRK
jgi:AcrR family transcriptional regulator